MSDPLNNYFGRRGTIFFSAAFCCLSVIGSAVTQNWWQLFITRVLLGIGMGSKASTVPIFCAENAPAAVRGGLGEYTSEPEGVEILLFDASYMQV